MGGSLTPTEVAARIVAVIGCPGEDGLTVFGPDRPIHRPLLVRSVDLGAIAFARAMGCDGVVACQDGESRTGTLQSIDNGVRLMVTAGIAAMDARQLMQPVRAEAMFAAQHNQPGLVAGAAAAAELPVIVVAGLMPLARQPLVEAEIRSAVEGLGRVARVGDVVTGLGMSPALATAGGRVLLVWGRVDDIAAPIVVDCDTHIGRSAPAMHAVFAAGVRTIVSTELSADVFRAIRSDPPGGAVVHLPAWPFDAHWLGLLGFDLGSAGIDPVLLDSGMDMKE